MRTKDMITLVMISAASLAYEISLTRIFAVQQFHHFSFIVISLAVMGYAASGVALSLVQTQPSPFRLAVGFTISGSLAYLIINFLPFDSYSIAWDPNQAWVLLLYFIGAGVPFLFAGWFAGQALTSAGESAYKPYAANLIGASLGCLIALVGLQFISEEATLGISLLLGAATTVTTAHRQLQRFISLALVCILLLALGNSFVDLSLRLSPYKPLSVAAQFPEAYISHTERNASVRIDILQSRGVHSFPGLSLTAPSATFPQVALFMDGEGPLPVTEASPTSPDVPIFAEHMPSGLAYLLRPDARALIINPGTGLSATIALALDAHEVVLPVDQPLIQNLMQGTLLAKSGFLYKDEHIKLIHRSSRSALGTQHNHYSVVEWSLTDPYRPITSGAFSLAEEFLLTQEAFIQGWQLLEPDGLMVITRWIGTPPSESARTWSTVISALRHEGLEDPGPHLAAYRGMRTATILVSKQPLSDQELNQIRAFLKSNAFDPIYLPDLEEEEINRYNRLPEPVYHKLFVDLLQDPEGTIHEYEFRLDPTHDDRPFFFHFFRWSQSQQILATLGVLWQPFGGSGYFVLLIMFILMLLLATPLVLLPWIALRRGQYKKQFPGWALLYFGGLGAGFMLVEIPLISRLGIFLDYPVLAFGIVLFTLLFSSGFGSIYSQRTSLTKSLVLLCGMLLINSLMLPSVIKYAMSFPLYLRILITMLWIAPAGFLMGIPFAAGLRRLEQGSQGLIPWAWAINGATSGLSGVLATLSLLDLGFQISIGIGIVCYGLALAATRAWRN